MPELLFKGEFGLKCETTRKTQNSREKMSKSGGKDFRQMDKTDLRGTGDRRI